MKFETNFHSGIALSAKQSTAGGTQTLGLNECIPWDILYWHPSTLLLYIHTRTPQHSLTFMYYFGGKLLQ